MKRSHTFLPAAGLIIFFLFALAGCKKYTCQCTAYSGTNPEPGGVGTFIVKGNAAKRKKNCTDRSTKPDAYGNQTQCVIID